MEKDDIIIETAEKFINASEIENKIRKNKNISISEIELDKKSAEKIGKNKGKYITIYFEKIESNVETILKELEVNLKNTIKYLNIKKNSKILIVGLGNKNITSDSLGYLVIEKMDIDNNIYKIYKEVEGLSNINTFDFVKMLSKKLEVNLIIIIDSLSAKSIERLNKTIQISTGGIKPGSALLKTSYEISEKTMKIPVIAIGVPTIINMNKFLKEKPKEELIVTSKDIDIEIENIATMLSIVINRILWHKTSNFSFSSYYNSNKGECYEKV